MVFLVLIIAIEFVYLTTSYFHTKEINLLITQCYEHDGEIMLEIHDSLTNSYSFTCKK
ncbi:hypothetical protein N784_12335 [Pontibacillus litoralis JSM 072002]|uniref:Uncharacterized protein n=1 Tax=Pontibacillus litoralis JSM 072002 TaxID=1385512 RepID=A0A0A5G445_9BACI|nr:hypothetical protein N784_12335 [Pontibacillus litoralis JSM 072002]